MRSATTARLRFEPDGSLVIPIGHAVRRWKRTGCRPAGRFYLILRLYHPSPAFAAGRNTSFRGAPRLNPETDDDLPSDPP